MADNRFSTPRIVVSRCLGFDACRYNGQSIADPFVKLLSKFVKFVTVCPEADIGLGVPRFPLRLVKDGSSIGIVQPATGKNATDEMSSYASAFAKDDGAVDGFILKHASPSCGPSGVRVYASPAGRPSGAKSAGVFAMAMKGIKPRVPVEDEKRLLNYMIRHHFLTAVFARARFREIHRTLSPGALVEFHSNYKYALMSYGQTDLRAMGKVVANPKGVPHETMFAAYSGLLSRAMSAPPTKTNTANALAHMGGYFTKDMPARERTFWLETLAMYREDRIPLSSVLLVLKSWALKRSNEYIIRQAMIEPFPPELMELRDSGRMLEI